MDLSLFTKVDTTPIRGGYRDDKMTVRMCKKGHRTVLSASLAKKAGWKVGDKVTLYRMGNTFALNRETAGLMKMHKNSGSTKSDSLVITNQRLWLETTPHASDIEVFDAWVEEGVVFFKRTATNE